MKLFTFSRERNLFSHIKLYFCTMRMLCSDLFPSEATHFLDWFGL